MGELEPPAPPATHERIADALATLEYQALLDDWKSRSLHERTQALERWRLVESRRDVRVQVEDTLRAAVHGAYLDVAKTSLERSLKRANFVTAGAGAIATTYTGLLALVFSVSGQQPVPMPATGIGPPLFLGLALVLSVAYAAFLSESRRSGRHLPTNVSPALQERRLVIFVGWVTRTTLERAWALRLSILSLGIGVALMPLPFLDLPVRLQWWLIATGGGAILLSALGELAGWYRKRP